MKKKTKKGRWQIIKYDNNGEAYVKHYNTKYTLDNFMRTGSKERELHENGNYIDGVHCISNCCVLCIEISNCGEMARLY